MSAKKAPKSRPKKQQRPAGTPTSARPGAGKPRPEKPTRRKALSPLEIQLRKALAEMGLARARRVFAAVEASFDD